MAVSVFSYSFFIELALVFAEVSVTDNDVPRWDPGSMSSQKILLVKKLPEETRVSSVVIGETGFYWRSFASPREVASALQRENFGLLFFDHRGVAGDPLAFIDSVRDSQKKTPVFLISDPLEMAGVIQAIRQGVKDYFQPPLDLRLIIERVQAVLKIGAQGPGGMQLEKWSEFVLFLADGSVGSATGPAKGEVRRMAGAADTGSLALAKAERDGLIAELETLRDQEQKTRNECDRLQREIVALKNIPPPKGEGVDSPTEGKEALERLRLELEEEREKIETERLLFDQERKKFAVIKRGATRNPGDDLSLREPTSAQQKATEEKSRQHVVAREKLEVELMHLVQSKARLEKEHAGRLEQMKAGLAEIAKEREKVASEQAAFDEAKTQWEKNLAAWQAEKAKLETDLNAREKAFSHVEAAARKLGEDEKKLVAEQENLEAEKSLLIQSGKKLEKMRSEQEERFTQRENILVDRALALDAQEKARSAAEDLFLVEQEKLDTAQALLVQERQSFEQVRGRFEKERAAAQEERAAADAEFARREKALAGLDDELEKIAGAQKKLAAEQEKLESAQILLAQAQTTLEQGRAEIEARQARCEEELVKRAQVLADQDRAREAAGKQLRDDRKKLEDALVAANQAQARVTQESKVLKLEKAQWSKSIAEGQAENARAEAALQKRIKDISDREDQVLQQERSVTSQKVRMVIEQEKLVAEQLVVSQTLARITSERAHVAAELTRLEKLKHELTEQEAAMEETEVKTQTQLTQLKRIQTQVAADQATLARDKAALAHESAALGARVGQFEARQQQFKAQMKQMLSGS